MQGIFHGQLRVALHIQLAGTTKRGIDARAADKPYQHMHIEALLDVRVGLLGLEPKRSTIGR